MHWHLSFLGSKMDSPEADGVLLGSHPHIRHPRLTLVGLGTVLIHSAPEGPLWNCREPCAPEVDWLQRSLRL